MPDTYDKLTTLSHLKILQAIPILVLTETIEWPNDKHIKGHDDLRNNYPLKTFTTTFVYVCVKDKLLTVVSSSIGLLQ